MSLECRVIILCEIDIITTNNAGLIMNIAALF